jgi:PKD repeat protein
VFRDCLIDVNVITVAAGDTASFHNCVFVGRTQAELEDGGVLGTVNFYDCDFDVTLRQNLPTTFADLSRQTLSYLRYGLEAVTDSSRVGQWESEGYSTDFTASPRFGVGAFYFSVPTAALSASPTSGAAPLEVEFGSNDDETTTPHWDFGDGNTSDEDDPTHIFKMPGEYVVTLTLTDVFGNTSTAQTTIYVLEMDYTGTGVDQGINVSFTNRCLRTAVKPMEGVGMVEWGGVGMVWPTAYVGTCKGYTARNEAISLVQDNREGRIYRVGIRELWTDKTTAGYGGTEIACRFRLKEHVAARGEHITLEHVENHVHFRPWSDAYRGASGYDDRGLRSAFEVEERLFVDGEVITPALRLQNIPRAGDYCFRNVRQCDRQQLEIVTATSAWRCVGIRQLINQLDQAKGPAEDYAQENQWQDEWAEMDVMIARDSLTPLLNRAAGVEATGAFDVLTTGPDGIDDSAIAFASGAWATIAADALSDEVTLSVWYANLVGLAGSPVILSMREPGTTRTTDLQIQEGANGLELLVVSHGTTVATIELQWNGDDWVHFALVRDDGIVRFYENGAQRGSFADTLMPWEQIDWPNGGICTSYGLIRVPNVVSAEAIAYHYDDVVNNEGNGGLFPVMR